ncbi:hypothetical protein [Meiothermus granaticius]|uniref:Uncharacterized protein n=1 Tax=Meiothermus granaticius NBRC 107808 TaxID=1227551 RepID=A0A399F5J1_9DEIN|nr:hypothetical protein [Meiothermus granaticius]RIH92037.1 hypothetical protein Mgrana_02110 [Meiothermus granaticius NBRC 107808]GEM86899.1 hypothetical protein MGR01S_15240 [Meiothermus granaticius NBRC 107808]
MEPHPKPTQPALILHTALAGVQTAIRQLGRPSPPQEPLQRLLDQVRSQLEELEHYLSQPGKGGTKTGPKLPPFLQLRLLGSSSVQWGRLSYELRPRFVELLCVLALHPEGLTSEGLALAVWGEGGDPGCAKTELYRLRRWIPLESRPYRLATPVVADFLEVIYLLRQGHPAQALELYKGPLLPRSEAPEVVETRVWLEESLREAVLHSGQRELVWGLAERLGSDLSLWEGALELLPHSDPRRPLATAQINRLKTHW